MTTQPQARIATLMTERRWTIDRCAYELNCTTSDLRWLLNGYPAENTKQQIRLDALVSALDAREVAETMHEAIRPTLMHRTPEPSKRRTPEPSKRTKPDRCKNGHWFGDRSSHYISRSGKRICYQCIEDRRVARGGLLSAAKSAIGTLNARGLRCVEIANITGISNASISDWRRGGSGITSNRLQALQQLVAVTNDLTGSERGTSNPHTPHPMLDEIRARFVSVGERVAA